MEHSVETILQCPISKSPLFPLNREDLEGINAGIRSRRFRHLSGTEIAGELDAALSSSGGKYIYPVVDGIYILLPSMAIVPRSNGMTEPQHALSSETRSVMDFYDLIGWQETDDAMCVDAERFEDLRPVSSEYIHRCHMRLGRYLPRRGRYILDAASGPIQYPEYLSYSDGFTYRICADVSFVALKKAKAKLADKGIYIQCDITSLPLKDESVDSFVSLHTIYHVHESKQLTAFQELYRVLQKPGRGIVVYTWGSASPLMKSFMPWHHLMAPAKKTLKAVLPTFLVEPLRRLVKPALEEKHVSSTTAEPTAYFYAHNYAWYRNEVKRWYDSEIVCWRSVSVPFLRTYVHERFLGHVFLSILFGLENGFPWFFGKYGQFPMIVFSKKET